MIKETCLIEVISGVEGSCLSIGDCNGGHRLAGPKPWGGGKTIHSFEIDPAELYRELKKYLPEDDKDTELARLRAELERVTSERDERYTTAATTLIKRLDRDNAVLQTELEKADTREKILRHLLWLRHGCDMLYGDDGERQCGHCRLDFNRDDPSVIAERWEQMGMEQMRCAALAPVASGEKVCEWHQAENDGFRAGCNGAMMSGDGPDEPDECGWVYCPFCGLRIKYTREYMPDSTTPAPAVKEEHKS